jgi:DNA-binding CsgD family transcriptional regulator
VSSDAGISLAAEPIATPVVATSAGCLTISAVLLEQLSQQNARARGAGAPAPRLEARALSPSGAWLEGPTADALFTRVVGPLREQEVEVLAAAWLRRHPVLRALATLAATPCAWLDLYLRAFHVLHPSAGLEHRWACGRIELGARAAGPDATRAWGRFAQHALAAAPTLLGAPRLRLHDARLEQGRMRFAVSVPTSGSAAARIAAATGVPLTAIFETLRALPTAALVGRTDGHPFATSDGRSSRDALAVFARDHRLTPGEARVLRQLDAGLRPTEIAAALAISTSTVRVHLKRMFAKTGAGGQRALLSLVDGRRLA